MKFSKYNIIHTTEQPKIRNIFYSTPYGEVRL